VAVAIEVSVVVVLVRSVTDMTSVIVAVSVVCMVTTDGVMVLLALANGVATVVLRIVSVLVTEAVAGVWRQEHKRAISEAGRDMMLEKTLACVKGASCLLRFWVTAVLATRRVVVTVVVLDALLVCRTADGHCMENSRCCCVYNCRLCRKGTGDIHSFLICLYSRLSGQSNVTVDSRG
jgi:hypothetical protein